MGRFPGHPAVPRSRRPICPSQMESPRTANDGHQNRQKTKLATFFNQFHFQRNDGDPITSWTNKKT